MKTVSAIVAACVIALALTQAVVATSTPPPLRMEEVVGEWIGQCQFGEVFRLSLNEDGSGVLGHVRAWDADDRIIVYEVTKIKLGNGTIRIKLRHDRWGPIDLEGSAGRASMSLRVKGLYRRAQPELHLIRPEAWESVLGRLRSAMGA